MGLQADLEALQQRDPALQEVMSPGLRSAASATTLPLPKGLFQPVGLKGIDFTGNKLHFVRGLQQIEV